MRDRRHTPPLLCPVLEDDRLRTVPQHLFAERGELVQPGCQCDEVIAGKLAHLAREVHAAIGQQDFGFADAAGIEDDLTGRGIAGVCCLADA